MVYRTCRYGSHREAASRLLRPLDGAHDGCRSRLHSLDRRGQSPDCYVRKLVNLEGIEPINLALKRRRLIPTSYRSKWSSRPGSNRHHSLIGRGLSAVELREDGGQVWFRPTPLRAGFTDPLTEPPSFPARLNWCHRSDSNGRSLPYQGIALPLCYGGGGWSRARSERLYGAHRLAGESGNLTGCTIQLEEGG